VTGLELHTAVEKYNDIVINPFLPRCVFGALFGQILYLDFQKLNFNHSKYPILLIIMFGMYLQIFSE